MGLDVGWPAEVRTPRASSSLGDDCQRRFAGALNVRDYCLGSGVGLCGLLCPGGLDLADVDVRAGRSLTQKGMYPPIQSHRPAISIDSRVMGTPALA